MESILSERLQQKEVELSARYDERLLNHHERYVTGVGSDPFTSIYIWPGSQRGRSAEAVKNPSRPVDRSSYIQ